MKPEMLPYSDRHLRLYSAPRDGDVEQVPFSIERCSLQHR
jgi:hypothetical protein